jgi:AcrR family transcriptional regulator
LSSDGKTDYTWFIKVLRGLSGFGRFWQVGEKMENDEKILSALLSSGTVAESAKKSGLSERTIYRRLADKDFRAAWREARQTTVEMAVSQLQAGMSEAAQTLIDSLRLGDKFASERNRAAKIILERGDKGLETFDVIERLEKLERMFEAKEKR